MEQPQGLAALPLEQLQALSDSRSFSFVPQTETSPGMAEDGTIAEASADMVPKPDPMSSTPEDAAITGGLNVSDERRKAVMSRIQNLRNAQASQEEMS